MGSHNALKIDENSTMLRHIIVKFPNMVDNEKSQVNSREKKTKRNKTNKKKKNTGVTQEIRIRLASDHSTQH